MFASVDGLVHSILTPTAYSIYLHIGDRLDLVVQTNDGKAPNALGHYAADSALYRAVVTEHLVLHVADPRGQQVLGSDGIIAGPLMDVDTGTAVGMLKIEGLPMTLLRQDILQAFKALCEWIGAAYRNAQRYEEANQSRMVHTDSQLYTDAYYRDVSAFVLSLAARARFEVSQLTVRVTHDALRKTGPVGSARPLAEVVRSSVAKGLRVTDLAFDYQQERGEFLILLPMTPAEHCQAVADRIREMMRAHLAELGHAARVSVTFETLYVPTADDVKPWHRPILRRVAPS
ncbi:MAG: GAF domain-containing protein [Deltaproteobacteria bacterium]|nr:GAF domain-containing protein [Deltaproteobacteria bacterium]